MLAHEPAEAAAERQAGDAGRGDHAAGGGQAVQLGLAVEPVPGDAALRPGGARLRVDVDALHQRQVDHQAALGGRAPRHVVAAAAHRDLEAPLARGFRASAMSATPRQRAMSAGRLSIRPLCTRLASS